MTTAEIAGILIDYCNQGKYYEAADELYADDIVSVEGMPDPSGSYETAGKEAVLKKSADWVESHEIHGAHAEGPFVAEKTFGVIFDFDVTNKPSGKRVKMRELGVYTVADGKIVREEFLYGNMG